MNDQRPIPLKLKSMSGQIIEITCLEILEIDGQPLNYGRDDVQARLIRLEERIAVLESLLSSQQELHAHVQ